LSFDKLAAAIMLGRVTHKSGKVAEMVAQFAGQRLDARYLGYFDCFNQQRYYEAHDVLEDLWLLDRQGPNGDFFKGLIQLAGAFVHLQKERLRPADALFQLAARNLAKYPARHESLSVVGLLELIQVWRGALAQGGFQANPLRTRPQPQLALPA
jgi:predicted metal-dependent hydrolase